VSWDNEDPRHHVYKWRSIIILRKNAAGQWEAAVGTVETKHTYHFYVKFGDLEFREWDRDWLWSYLPEEAL